MTVAIAIPDFGAVFSGPANSDTGGGIGPMPFQTCARPMHWYPGTVRTGYWPCADTVTGAAIAKVAPAKNEDNFTVTTLR